MRCVFISTMRAAILIRRSLSVSNWATRQDEAPGTAAGCRSPGGVDETYVRVKRRWKYLYRAIDKGGATLDFYLADRRNAKAAKQ